jgi:hypothetical protein
MITGAGLMVIGFNWLEPLALAFGDWGKLTIPTVFHSSPWPIIAAFASAALVVLLLITRRERKAAHS